MKKFSLSKRSLLIVAVVVGVLAVVAGAYLYSVSRANVQVLDGGPAHDGSGQPKPQSTSSSQPAQPSDTAQPSASDQSDLPSKTPAPATTSDIGVTISRANQAGSGQPLAIRTVINGTTTGECHVTLTKAGQPTITKTYAVVFEATTTSCSNANIAASEFSVGGDWQLSVSVQKDDKISNPATQTVTIK